MARLARNQLLYDGCYAHVMSRTISKNSILKDDQDFDVFRGLLLAIKRSAGFKIFHYCMMHTHFHLAVQIPQILSFARALQKLKSQYTYHYHTKYKEVGPLWRQRYLSLVIENESYLYACGQYIEYNPVKAGLVKDKIGWLYSSGRHYETGEADDVVDAYDVMPELPHGIDLFSKDIFEGSRGIGSSFFRFQLKERLSKGRQHVY